MSGGIGRGRGWLNLKNQNANAPGAEMNVTHIISNHDSSPNLNSVENSKYSDASHDYSNLISKINQLNINDDGIKFNQKIKYIVESWLEGCENSYEVEKSFDVIHQACLADGDLANKLVHLIASRTFLNQEIHEQNIRLMFLRKLQDNFENCVQVQKLNPTYFRNCVQMMGEFYNKARLANGQLFSFMAAPLLTYLDMLLDSAEIMDLSLFTSLIYSNGSSLKQECPETVTNILSKIRFMLACNNSLTKECRFWLLLAVEVASNRFTLLPADVHSFYQQQLGDHAMACFQGTHGALTVQTMHSSKNLDSYQSNVNVLQVSTSTESAPSTADPVSPHNSTTEYGPSTNFTVNSSGFQSDLSQNSGSNRRDNHSKGGKTGRPILGAGARLKTKFQNDSSSNREDKPQNDSNNGSWNRSRSHNNSEQTGTGNWHKNKNRSSDESTENNWREKDDKKSVDQVNHKKEWEKKKVLSKSSKKGWEHDDRFDNDYS